MMSDDEESDSHLDAEDELPFVTAELERRMEDPSITEPAPLSVVEELRDYLTNDGNPFMLGGYLDVMHQLGHPPQSTDPLCASQYNVWSCEMDGVETSSKKEWEQLRLTMRPKFDC